MRIPLNLTLFSLALLALSPEMVRSQDLASVSAHAGRIWLSGALRIIPYAEADGSDTRTRMSPSTFASLAVEFGTPLELLNFEMVGASTIGSNLMEKEIVYSSCGPNCTRGVEESFPIGEAQMISGGIDAVLKSPWLIPVNLAAVIGAGVRRYSFDQDALGANAEAFGGDETRPYWNYGLRVGPNLSARLSIDAGLQIMHSAITTNVRASDDSGIIQKKNPQSDWAVYAGLRLRT